ncbi:MAG: enoyl-CoA hydratase [Sphingobium sp.]|nr:MAG: enoyl-CoA hydratase [Sphingobium sp.]
MTQAPVAEEPHLLTHVDDAILIATLNRPAKLNALSGEALRLFNEALLRFRDDPDLKVMLVRATGRYFCAGVDLKSGTRPAPPKTASQVRERHRTGLNGMHRMYDEMEAIEKPIVVAHHAPCVGGGLELSLSCDFRLAAKSAHYSFPEGKQGVIPASNGVSRLTRIVGTHWARYFIMANKLVDADRAYVMGLVHEVFPDESFEEEVMAFCRHLAAQNGEQMGTAKLAIELARDVNLAQARNVERLANSALIMNPDHETLFRRHLETVGSKDKP